VLSGGLIIVRLYGKCLLGGRRWCLDGVWELGKQGCWWMIENGTGFSCGFDTLVWLENVGR